MTDAIPAHDTTDATHPNGLSAPTGPGDAAKPTTADPATAPPDAASTDPPSEPRVIKRYANRKLYDTSRSEYVTLDAVADMIREGEDVRVIDKRTQEDLTAVTLAQIIFEQQKSRRRAMPLSTLRAIIERPAELFQRLSAPVTNLRDQVDRQVDRLKTRRTEAVDEGRQVVIETVESLQAAIEETQHKLDDRLKTAVDALTHVPDLERSFDGLRERIERLEHMTRRLAEHVGLPDE